MGAAVTILGTANPDKSDDSAIAKNLYGNGHVTDDLATERCQEDGSYFQFCSPSQRDDLKLAVEAVSSRGSALQVSQPARTFWEKVGMLPKDVSCRLPTQVRIRQA